MDSWRSPVSSALEQRQDAWRRQQRSISYVAQCRDLTELRADGMGPLGMNCHAMRDPLRRLDRAFAAFFRRVKAGQKPGYPRFRSRRRYDSLTWDSGWVLREGRLALQGIRHLKVRWHRPLPGGAALRRFDVIYVEALNLKGLAQSRLARDVHDQGWGAFLAILTDKAEEAGRSVMALDAGIPPSGARPAERWCPSPLVNAGIIVPAATKRTAMSMPRAISSGSARAVKRQRGPLGRA